MAAPSLFLLETFDKGINTLISHGQVDILTRIYPGSADPNYFAVQVQNGAAGTSIGDWSGKLDHIYIVYRAEAGYDTIGDGVEQS